MSTIDHFTSTVSSDLFNLMTGEWIGCGVARQVYVFAPDPKYVIKFETNAHSFQNIMEWEFWQDAQWSPDLHKWLAPCKMISSCGKVLIQERTHPMIPSKRPKLIPIWATDTKDSNWGLIKNKPVIHDYALRCHNPGKRLVKAKFYNTDFQKSKN